MFQAVKKNIMVYLFIRLNVGRSYHCFCGCTFIL